ncbi:MAG TPA: WD40 repeat domain-containing protein, partial [Anaerolineaceae bacterium]|nr:WD40 repeat domain-containing protein [Anaerolineaceae bacterium]
VPSPMPLQVLNANNAARLQPYDDLIVAYPFHLVWSLDSTILGVMGREGVFLYNRQDWTPRATLLTQQQEIFLDISPDGQTLALTLDQRSIELRNIQNGEKIKMLLPPWFFSSAFFDPDGQTLVMPQVESPAVDVWNLKTGEISQTVRGFPPGTQAWRASFPGPAGYLAWASGNAVQIIDLQTKLSTPMMRQSEEVGALALSPDGGTLASAGGTQVYLWNTNQGTLIARLALAAPAATLDFSPDGGLLVVSTGGQLLIWESVTWNQVATLTLPNGTVLSLAFAPDGTQFACGTSDGSVTFWGVR